jgi:hypothetical protein
LLSWLDLCSEELRQVPPEMQIMTMQNQYLEDHNSLSFYSITSKSQIEVKFNPSSEIVQIQVKLVV